MRARGRRPDEYAPDAAGEAAQAAEWQRQMLSQGYTPEQIAQMQAQAQSAQGYTPEQIAQMQAAQMQAQAQSAQGYTPEQIAQMQAAQMQPAQGYAPEQIAQMQAAQMQAQAQQGYTPEQLSQIQAAQAALDWQQQLAQQGYTPEQIAQMQAAQATGWQQAAPFPQAAQPSPAAQAYGWFQAQGYAPEQIAQLMASQGYAPQQVAQAQYELFLYQDASPAPPTAQPAPEPGRRRPRKAKRPKRPRAPLTRGQMIARGIAVAAALAVAVWLGLRALLPGRATTAVVERSEIGNVYAGDALIVRNETAYDEEGVQSIDYVAQEGGNVYLGDVVCYVYSTGYSTKETTTLQDYRDQIKNYQRTLLKSETAYDQKMTRLESEVLERGLEVRSLVQGARGNLINQEVILETAIDQRQAYFRSKYSSDMRLNRLYDDEKTQETRIGSWIKQKVATEESIVSFYTDGFEYALSPSRFESYTPSQVRAMIGGSVPETSLASRGRTDLYRLVKKNNYAVLFLINSTAWNPVEGAVFKLVLEQFSDTTVNARVLSSTRAGGELLVRFAVIGDVTDVLYMRTCRARIGEYVDCMVVPESALHEQNDAVGVVIVGSQESLFTPVRVLRQEGGKAYITAIQTGILNEGQTVLLFN